MNNKKEVKKFAACIIIGLLIGIVIVQRTKIIQFENDERQNIAEEIALEKCPFCNGKAVIQPVQDSFYIECEKCELHTDFFKSKEKLIRYWNNRNGD